MATNKNVKNEKSMNKHMNKIKEVFSIKWVNVLLVSILLALFPLAGYIGMNFGIDHWNIAIGKRMVVEALATVFIFGLGLVFHRQYHNEERCKNHFWISCFINALTVSAFVVAIFVNNSVLNGLKENVGFSQDFNSWIMIGLLFIKSTAKFVNDFKKLT